MPTKKPYRVVRTRAANADLDAIARFLIENDLRYGVRFDSARERASRRLKQINEALRGLGKVPYQGTQHDGLIPGLRHVTKDRAIFYFTVDDEAQILRVLAVFFGGQDHQRKMLKRLRALT